jgi:hypothetical protein
MAKGFCIGVLPIFARHPTSRLHSADNGLPAGMNMDVLDRDLLLALAPVAVQGFEKSAVCSGELVRLGEVLLTALKRLLGEHRAAVALHRGAMGCHELAREHAFQLVLGCDPHEGASHGGVLLILQRLA